nr:MAG TPA: hypothetical protein [Caudoviricetes sp.]
MRLFQLPEPVVIFSHRLFLYPSAMFQGKGYKNKTTLQKKQ